MNATLERCLTDLAERIDEAQEEAYHAAWRKFLDDRWEEDIFVAPGRRPAPPRVDWPTVTVNQALADPDAMLLQQFRTCSEVLAAGGSATPSVRCNYGTPIIPSLFGCELFLMDDKLNTLPANRPLPDHDALKAAVDRGVPDVAGGLGGRVFSTAEQFLAVFKRWPILQRWVKLFHPDAQGPIDNAETIWGSTLFYAFYDEPDFVRAFLNLQTDTYAAFLRRWYDLVGPEPEYATHWWVMHKGTIVLRNDSLMNLSPEVYVDFVRPLDQRLFDEFGGGFIHYCGRGDHFVPAMSEMRGLTAINLSQPELNNMDTIYAHTIDKGIKLLSLRRDAAAAAGRPLNGRVHCPE